MATKATLAEGVEAVGRDGRAMLMPLGAIAARDGRRFAVADAAAIVAASQPRAGGPAPSRPPAGSPPWRPGPTASSATSGGRSAPRG